MKEETTTKKKFPAAMMIFLAVLLCVGVASAIFFANQDVDDLRETVAGFLKRARDSQWGFPITMGTYLVGALIVFPVTVLNLAASMVFGPIWGFIYGVSGALLSASMMFGIGHLARKTGLKDFFQRGKMKKLDDGLKKGGVIGITMLGFMPIAPFTFFCLAGGVSSVRYFTFISGVALALLPGGIARSILGDSLMRIFLHPKPETFIYLGAGLILWFSTLAGVHFGLKKYTARHGQ